jgi:hypothetical protein
MTNKMSNDSKIHYCDKMVENKVCGEMNPTNFEAGRYSTCKRCRIKINNKNRTIKNKKLENDIYETKANIIDPDVDIRYLIEETINNVNFIRKKSIINAILDMEQDITDVLTGSDEKIDKIWNEINLLREKNRILENVNSHLQDRLTDLEIRILKLES